MNSKTVLGQKNVYKKLQKIQKNVYKKLQKILSVFCQYSQKGKFLRNLKILRYDGSQVKLNDQPY